MEIEEYRELEISEIVGNVRCSNIAKDCSILQLRLKQGLIGHILNLLKYRGSVDDLDKYVSSESFLQLFCGLSGDGFLTNPFTIHTEFASGGFIDLQDFMPNNTIPSYIENNACHKNSFIFAMQTKDADVLTGIYGYKGNKNMNLHSVVEIQGIVLDFNWKIAMTKELYLQLFNFEVLSQVSGKKLAEDYDTIVQGVELIGNKFTYAELLACYDDVLEYIKEIIKKNSL